MRGEDDEADASDDDFEPLQLLTHLNASPRKLHLPPAPPVRGKTSIWDVILPVIAGGMMYFAAGGSIPV